MIISLDKTLPVFPEDDTTIFSSNLEYQDISFPLIQEITVKLVCENEAIGTDPKISHIGIMVTYLISILGHNTP